VRAAISGYQVTRATIPAASAITSGAYFNIYTASIQYVVWYNKDGTGSQPSVPGATFIEVAITTGDTAGTVMSKTLIAMNAKYFATPDLRGQFLRGVDLGAGVDLGERYTVLDGIAAQALGTFESYYTSTHYHDLVNGTGHAQITLNTINASKTPGATGQLLWDFANTSPTDISTTADIEISGATEYQAAGKGETMPVNANIVWAIKY
jgi:hypothetical protein